MQRVRDSIDYPLAGLALMVKWAGKGEGSPRDSRAGSRTGLKILAGLRLALTAVNPAPVEVPGLHDLLGREFNLDMVEELGRRAGRIAKPLRTSVVDPAYRRAMVTALIEKAAARLAPELAGPLTEKARWA